MPPSQPAEAIQVTQAPEASEPIQAAIPLRGAKRMKDAIEVFLTEKRVEGLSADPLAKYTRELGRLREFLKSRGIHSIQGVNREILTRYCETWLEAYPSSQTRVIVRARLRAFVRYCYEAGWLGRIPQLPKITADEIPTMPLSAEEFDAILSAVDTVIKDPGVRLRARGLLLLMRHTGLTIGDSLKLRRSALIYDAAKKLFRVTTKRQKTGIHVSVAIPTAVAIEIIAVPNSEWTVKANGSKILGHPGYIFWDAKSRIVDTFTKTVIGPCFKAAGIVKVGNYDFPSNQGQLRRRSAREGRPHVRALPAPRPCQHPRDGKELREVEPRTARSG